MLLKNSMIGVRPETAERYAPRAKTPKARGSEGKYLAYMSEKRRSKSPGEGRLSSVSPMWDGPVKSLRASWPFSVKK